MRRLALGAHLQREDIEPLAEAVPAGALFLSAVSIPDEQSLSDRDLLLQVAAIRTRLLERATFIAIRYGFTFRTDAEAAERCAPHAERWRRLLAGERDRVEMTLKAAAAAGAGRPDRHDFKSGADYLLALHAARDAAAVDPAFRSAVEELIVPLAIRHRWTTRDASSVELAALIDRKRIDEITRAGEALKRRCPQVPFLLSGPWPLEVFADADQQ